MFLRILTAHANPHATSSIKRARQVLNWTMIGQMAIAIALIGFNDLGHSVTPTFLLRNRFNLQYYYYLHIICPKMNKKSMWEVKIFLRFLPTGHVILPSCGCKARGTMVVKCELVYWWTSTVDWIHLLGPLKPYLAEHISLQSSNCNIIFCDLQPLWPSSKTKPDLLRLGVLPGMLISPKRSRWPPIFFTFLASLTHHLSMVTFSEKINVRKILHERP